MDSAILYVDRIAPPRITGFSEISGLQARGGFEGSATVQLEDTCSFLAVLDMFNLGMEQNVETPLLVRNVA